MKPKIDSEPLADWYPLTRQFKLTLKVSGRSPRTTEAYDLAIRALLSYLLKMGLRIGPPDVTAEHLPGRKAIWTSCWSSKGRPPSTSIWA